MAGFTVKTERSLCYFIHGSGARMKKFTHIRRDRLQCLR